MAERPKRSIYLFSMATRLSSARGYILIMIIILHQKITASIFYTADSVFLTPLCKLVNDQLDTFLQNYFLILVNPSAKTINMF